MSIENLLEDIPSFLDTQEKPQGLVAQQAPKDNSSIAIIGMSGRFPKAANLSIFWENLKNGKNCISEVPQRKWDIPTHYDLNKEAKGKSYAKWMGSLTDEDKFDALFFNISPREAERMDPQQRLFLEESWKALEDAGYHSGNLNKEKCGVFVGVGQGDYLSLIHI